MIERSILFVPGDSAKKIARAADCQADAIVLDLEDSVAPSRRAEARAMVRAALDARAGSHRYWVRINALDSAEALADLAAVVGGAPDVILLPKASGASDVIQLNHHLSALEVRDGVAPGSIKVVAVATETGAAIFGLGSYAPACPRLAGLTWGAEDLASAVGAASNSDEQGRLTPLYEMARGLCLAAAAAAGVEPIDTAFMDIRDLEALARNCAAARRDGFRAKLAIHPDQVPVINATFTPSPAEVERAQKIVDAFATDPDVGVLQLDGRMVDRPHLEQAHKILAVHQLLVKKERSWT